LLSRNRISSRADASSALYTVKSRHSNLLQYIYLFVFICPPSDERSGQKASATVRPGARWGEARCRMDPVSPVSSRAPSVTLTPPLVNLGYICHHWGRWDSYSALRKAANICKQCRVLRDGFRLHFSARVEGETEDLKRLDDEICAHFPLDGKLPGQSTSFQLHSLNSFAAVIEARAGNTRMECIVILRTGNSIFAPGRLNS
jgi:hypothetical protein